MAGRQKHSRLGKELIAGMKEVAAYARGEIELPTRVVEVPEAVDVAAPPRAVRRVTKTSRPLKLAHCQVSMFLRRK